MGKAIKCSNSNSNKTIKDLINLFSLSKSFSYNGEIQNFICPIKGVYKITIAGGSGGGAIGNGSSTGAGGNTGNGYCKIELIA